MPETHRNPRSIAKEKNQASGFEDAFAGYDSDAGVPASAGVSQGKPRDYAANPLNPPEGAAPAKGLKR